MEKIVRLNEKRIAKLDMLIANAQTANITEQLKIAHDNAIAEWHKNYEKLLLLISILE